MLSKTMQPNSVSDGNVIQGAEDGTEECSFVGHQLSSVKFRGCFEHPLIHPAVVLGHQRCTLRGHYRCLTICVTCRRSAQRGGYRGATLPGGQVDASVRHHPSSPLVRQQGPRL